MDVRQREAIWAAKRGERVAGEFSLHAAEKPDADRCAHSWRTIFCDSETDVLECRTCGRQQTAKCDFDEEFA